MNKSRLLLVSVVVLAIALLSSSWSGRGAKESIEATGLGVPVIGAQSDASSTWFCTAGSAPLDPVPHHQVAITNVGQRSTPVRVTAYGPDGVAGTHTVHVAANEANIVDLDTTFSAAGLSAMVEAPRGAISVSSWLLSAKVGDISQCERESSSVWYFPSQTTVTGSTASLVLFNPFSSDAGVDISAAVSDGIRSPTEWAGVVVPAGTTKVIDLSQFIQRRDQFSVTVEVRSGRVFANSVQTYTKVELEPSPVVTGLRLTRPVANPRSKWVFAGGFKDSGAAESIVVQNPGSSSVTVSVQVSPYGTDQDLAPEPFEMQVPPRRYAVLDLTQEGRVPDVGFHSITVESNQGRPIVVQRRIRISAEPTTDESTVTRPDIATGVAATTGSTGGARNWVIPGVITGRSNTPLAFIHNPGDEAATIKVVTTDDDGNSVVLVENHEIPPSDGLALPLTHESLADAAVRVYEVSATAPVVVEQLVTLNAIPDLAVTSAFPLGRQN
ncbi:MAG: hypothetical protein KDB26_01675 [Microthrixaceae bacterium]|nr:hypothetical protein [Microthrixaceae bacterium]